MCTSCETLHDAIAHRDGKAKAKTKAKPVPMRGTHQTYIDAIYKTALKLAPGLTKEDRVKLSAIKLAYGAGPDGTRGVTYYNRWKKPDGKTAIPLVAVCATGQESHVQVCGTTLHELAHVIAGWQAGHGQGWTDACTKLGLTNMSAGGTDYQWSENFTPEMAKALQALPLPADGTPVSTIGAAVGALLGPWGRPLLGGAVSIKPCGAGFGTRGGKSRGQGSGSRYLKYTCKCKERNSLRCAGTELDATCNKCKSKFVLDGESLPPAHKPVVAKPVKAKKTKKAKK
jgi:hypothetical protein